MTGKIGTHIDRQTEKWNKIKIITINESSLTFSCIVVINEAADDVLEQLDKYFDDDPASILIKKNLFSNYLKKCKNVIKCYVVIV